MTAYNPTTGEYAVQFMPLIEDRSDVINDLSAVDLAKGTHLYQKWFFQRLQELDKFCNVSVSPCTDCKRRIFGTKLINNQMSNNSTGHEELNNMTRENCPLIYLQVHYGNDTAKGVDSEVLHFIDVRLNIFIEDLGFFVFGEPETLADLTRFLRELILQSERAMSSIVDDQSTPTRTIYVNGSPNTFFDGDLFAARYNESTSFGKRFAEYIYDTIDMTNGEEVKRKIRNSNYAAQLYDIHRTNAAPLFNRWIRMNNFDLQPHCLHADDVDAQRAMLVFRAITKTNVTKEEKGTFIPDLSNNDKNKAFGIDIHSPFSYMINRLPVTKYLTTVAKIIQEDAFKKRKSSYIQIKIQLKNTEKYENYNQMRYSVSMFSGIEKNVQTYVNYFVEPDPYILFVLGLDKEKKGSLLAQRLTRNFFWPANADELKKFYSSLDDERQRIQTENETKYWKKSTVDNDTGDNITHSYEGSAWRFPVRHKLADDQISVGREKHIPIACEDFTKNPTSDLEENYAIARKIEKTDPDEKSNQMHRHTPLQCKTET